MPGFLLKRGVVTVALPNCAVLAGYVAPSARRFDWGFVRAETFFDIFHQPPLLKDQVSAARQFYILAATAAEIFVAARMANHHFTMPDLAGLKPTVRSNGDQIDVVASMEFDALLAGRRREENVRIYVAVIGREDLGRFGEIRLTHAIGEPVHEIGDRWYDNSLLRKGETLGLIQPRETEAFQPQHVGRLFSNISRREPT